MGKKTITFSLISNNHKASIESEVETDGFNVYINGIPVIGLLSSGQFCAYKLSDHSKNELKEIGVLLTDNAVSII